MYVAFNSPVRLGHGLCESFKIKCDVGFGESHVESLKGWEIGVPCPSPDVPLLYLELEAKAIDRSVPEDVLHLQFSLLEVCQIFNG